MPLSKRKPALARRTKLTDYYTFEEARRKRYGIYTALLSEVYEAGCTIVDKIFLQIIESECKLLDLHVLSKSMGTKYPRLCATLIRKAISAEKVVKSASFGCNNVCLEILYEMLCILEKYNDTGWLMEKLYIASLYVNNVLLKSKKGHILAKIHYRHGKFLSKHCDSIFKALSAFREALIICHEETWLAEDLDDTNENLTLHDCIALEMTKTLIALSKTADEPLEDVNLKYKICTIMENLKQENHEYLFEEVILMEARYLREMNSYVKCLSVLCYLERHMRGLDPADQKVDIICDLYYQQGICYRELSEFEKALDKFREVRLLAIEHNMLVWLGKALVGMGQMYEKYPTRYNEAKLCFKHAIDNFSGVDVYRRNAVRFSLGSLMAKEVFRHVLRNAKKSQESKQHLINLLNWKVRLAPLCEFQNNEAFYVRNTGSQGNLEVFSKLRLSESNGDLYRNQLFRMENSITITDNNLLRYAKYLTEKLSSLICM